MHFLGDTYRPPFEEKSLLIPVSAGCSHNQCKFCNLYGETEFQVNSLEVIEEDISSVAKYRTLYKRVFLVGGDPFTLPFESLKFIAETINKKLPRIESIGCHASIMNVMTKTPDQLQELSELGFDDINIGLETGLDAVLEYMDKGYTSAEAKEALLNLNDARIAYNLNLVTGLGGPELSMENADASANLLNEVQPKLVMVAPLHMEPGAELEKMEEAGEFTQCTLGQIIDEQIRVLEKSDLKNTIYFGMQSVNPIRTNGTLNADKEYLIKELENGRNHFPEHQLNEPIRWFPPKVKLNASRTM